MAFNGAQGEIYDEVRKNKVLSLTGDRSEGVAGISAPVFDAMEKLVGALTLTMPVTRFKQSYNQAVKQAALTITKGLGGPAQLYE
jgi:DNA-binding IclR family transcriptional regulator